MQNLINFVRLIDDLNPVFKGEVDLIRLGWVSC